MIAGCAVAAERPDALVTRNAYGKVPLSFELNQGQTDARVKFLTRASTYTLFVKADEAVFAGRDGSVERVKFSGANRKARVEPLEKQPGTSNYFLSEDPTKWRTSIATYGKVAIRGVYRGIDLVFYSSEGRVEYDWVVAPGADLRQIRMKWEVAGQIRKDASGNLALGSALWQKKPVILQAGKSIEGEYVVRGKEVRFEVAKYDVTKPLLIDPVFVYSTYLSRAGGSIAVDSAANAYVAGGTNAANFPTGNPLQASYGGGNSDACVTKINASGSALVYTVCLGGSGDESAGGIAIDGAGNAYITGTTTSPDFPTSNAFQASNHGTFAISNVFVTKINASGTALVYSTYLGGSGGLHQEADGGIPRGDSPVGIAVDGAGNAYITGTAMSADFPIKNPLQANKSDPSAFSMFVTKIDASGSTLVYSTYLGGNAGAGGIAADIAGNAYVAGTTSSSTGFPTSNRLQLGGTGSDVFVTKINPTGSALLYAAFFGGSGQDFASGIAIDGAGNSYVTGGTRSTDFPIVGAVQTSNHDAPNHGTNAFVTKINSSGSALLYSTYLGGHEFNFGGGDAATGIAVDAAGDALVTGYTSSLDFPVVNALQPNYGGGIVDVFVTKFNPSGSALLYSTYLGGSGSDFGYGIAVGSNGNAYVTGVTSPQLFPLRVPNNFPTFNPLQGSSPGGDPFVTVIGTPLVNITTTSPITPGVINLPYTDTLEATDGIQPYTWSATGLPVGLTLDSGTGVLSGLPRVTGSTTFSLTVTDALGHSATQSLTILIDSTCSYQLNPGGQAFPAAGGTGIVNIIAPAGCGWWTTIGPAWITGLTTGNGNGSFTYQVRANSGADRSATLTVAGLSFSVEQQGGAIPGLSFIGTMPHIAAEENWTTMFTLVNKSATPATARLSLFGDPFGTLQLPLTFPQQAAAPNPLLTNSFDRTISANASLIVETAGPQTPPVKIGSAQLAATGAIDGFAIFHHVLTQQETVVPLETRNASSYLLAYDNTGGNVLGVAIAGITTPPGSSGVSIRIRDDVGNEIGGGGFNVNAGGHFSFVLPTQFPITANRRGTIELSPIPSSCQTGESPAPLCTGQISVLGMRFTPPNNALTTIPPLANVGTGGGSMAHIATGNGWKTTFVLVNTGTSAAPVQLNFFADNGSPLALPIGFPQLGSGATSVAPFVNQTLAAGATLVVESAAPESDPTPTVGSAQLTSSGNVSGFAIFRYNPNGQEAVVPFESRNASAYLLAFDNTAGTATGVAINSVSAQPVDVPVVIRDDTGTLIASDTLHLAANGHFAFTLAKERYPATASIRGTIEFDTPPGAQIGALAFRIPTAHTFTTLPALVK